jgi:hypothetical protein
MAASNRTKGAEKSPKWAQRASLRLAYIPGGPARAAENILQNTWDKSPLGLLPACRYSIELADELAARHINAVCLSWSIGFSHEGDAAQWSVVAALLPHLRKKKIRVLAEVALDKVYLEELSAKLPAASEWVHQPQTDEYRKLQGPNAAAVSILKLQQPEWRAYLEEKVRAGLKAGLDGFFFTSAGSDNPAVLAVVERLREIIAGEPNAQEIAVYTNVCGDSRFNAVCNIKWDPACMRPRVENGELISNLPLWKLYFEDGGRDKSFAAGFLEGSMQDRLAQRAAAEVLAGGGAPSGLHLPENLLAFHAENEHLFHGDPRGGLAVLMEGAGALYGAKVSTDPLCAALLRNSVQFDVLPITQLKVSGLRRYNAASAIHLAHLSAETIDQLHGFVARQGGTLFVSPGTGTRTAQGDPCEPPAFLLVDDDGNERVEKPVGKGKVVVLPPPLQGFLGSPQKEFGPALIEEIRSAAPVEIRVESSADMTALLWGKGTARWIHVINYGDQPADVTVGLPGCGGRKAEVYSPDEKKPAFELQDSGSGLVKFTLKSLDVYAVVAVE